MELFYCETCKKFYYEDDLKIVKLQERTMTDPEIETYCCPDCGEDYEYMDVMESAEDINKIIRNIV